MAEVQRQQTPAGERRRPRKLNRQPTRNGADENKENEPVTQPEVPIEAGEENFAAEDTGAQEPVSSSSSPRQQRRRKPRKLLRISSDRPLHAEHEAATASPGSQDTLAVRVDQLEQHVVRINRRLDTAALELATLQAAQSARAVGPRARAARTRSSRLASRAPSVASVAHTERTERSGRVGERVDEEDEAGYQADELFAPNAMAGPDTDVLPPVQRTLFRNINDATERISRLNPPTVNAGPSSPRRTQSHGVVEELDGDDDIEEIPHASGSGPSSSTPRTVSLSGRYRIPLPPSIQTSDVRALRSGVAAAGTIAREISAAFRTSASGTAQASVDTQPFSDAVKETETLDGSAAAGASSPRSWVALLGGASRVVRDAAGLIEVDAAVEARPAGAGGAGGAGSAGQGSRRRRALPPAASAGVDGAGRRGQTRRVRASARRGGTRDAARSPPASASEPSASSGQTTELAANAVPGGAEASLGEASASRPTSSRGVASGSGSATAVSSSAGAKGKARDRNS